MRKLILAGAILALAGSTHVFALGGNGHSHGHMRHDGLRPASPSVPPSLTPDARLTGDAPLPPRDPEDLALDRMIGSICRGC
jgi:hypothetical protein